MGSFRCPGRSRTFRENRGETPGILRLILEFALFGAATWMMFDLGRDRLGRIMGAAILVHYILSYDRIAWLIKQK
jgi:hypothetical protein